MITNQIERGDILALKDGRQVEVLTVRMEGEELRRFDYIDRNEVSPMRKTAYPSEINTLIRKSVAKKAPGPLETRTHDNPVPKPIPVTVVNHEANPEAHPAVSQAPAPVLQRGKTDRPTSKTKGK